MPGKEDYFLRFNKDKIFKNLLQIEGHFVEVAKAIANDGDLSCVVKHSADAEGHCDEAVSHALISESREKSGRFARLADILNGLRWKVMEKKVSPEEGIREIREIRGFFERFNPEYDISKCTSCGNVRDLVQNFVLKNGSDGKVIRKTLNSKGNIKFNSETRLTVNNKEIALVYLSDWIAKGAGDLVFEWMDAAYPAGLLGQRPSTVGRAATAAIGTVLAAKWNKLRDPYDRVALLMSAQISTGLFDEVQRMFVQPVLGMGRQYVQIPPSQISNPNVKPMTYGQGALGKYT